ncbi:D(3) dopamine receptor [Amblyraja radiata]|uniref:D(3) dopamine receptor n=1 Tax=Amblyraja radiata TaxID=386614 RepID=UPI0014042674|nr:D(3) dopamine receptor [Amblyraja radiata]XP_032889181.1 D(3) dopamine receptor [Amblyraja radiata]
MASFAMVFRFVNTTDPLLGWLNSTDRDHSPNYFALFFILLIFAIVFGNVLVCLAVLKEKSLQTTTNYLVVSLAVADMLVATLVMPWVVYLEVVRVWRFSQTSCNIFVTLDVMMCTASILNLCAISIDRYTAVVMPIQYNTNCSSRRRVTGMIIAVWILSLAVSCPLLFGFNTTDDPRLCSISNPDFVVYSSIVSFYLPFLITLLVYIRIYFVLKKRRKRINLRQNTVTVATKVAAQSQIIQEKKEHFPKIFHSLACLNVSKRTGLSPNSELQSPIGIANYCTISQALFAHSENEIEKSDKKSVCATKRASEVKNMSSGKTATSLRPALKHRNLHTRERKVTRMLVVVLGMFLICWLPFFITHILNTHCKRCHVSLELYSATTWLGYVNSAINPIIYTTFNTEFRRAFLRILSC